MRPPRLSRRALAAIVALSGFAAAAIVAPERIRPDAVGVLDSSLRGTRVLGPGVHLRLRHLERVVPCSPFPYQSTIRFVTPEGSTLQARVAASLWLDPDGARRLIAGGGDRGRAGATALLDGGFDHVIRTVLTDAARTSRVPDLGPVMQDRIARALSAYGRNPDNLVIDYLDAGGAVYATRQAEQKAALRRDLRDTGVKILLVGLDGADWQIADPLIAAGRMPNLARLKERGAWGSVRSLRPSLSPLLWTSIATGTTPDRHGITDFLVRDPDSGRLAPVTSLRRRAPAFWDYYTWAGRTVDVVAWWATWPAERINGRMVSDRVSYSLFDFDLPAEGTGTTWPPEYFAEIRGRIVDRDQVSPADLAFFVETDPTAPPAGADGRTTAPPAGKDTAYRDPVDHLAAILASLRTYHAVTLDLLSRGQPDMLAVYYEAIDEVSHRFMHFVPPALHGIDPALVARFGRAVDRIYEYQDRLLGELLAAVDPSTVVIVVADHGFVNGPDRPVGLTADIEGQPGRWHRPFGILVLSGGPIAPGPLPATSLLDLLPTILHVAGLPVPETIRGRPLLAALDARFQSRFPVRSVPSFESGTFSPDTGPVTATMAAVEESFVEKLRSLGYIGDTGPAAGPAAIAAAAPPGGAATGDALVAGADTVTAHSNLAGVLLADGRLAEAEREILAALALVADFRPARHQLVELRARQGRTSDAIAAAEQLLREGAGVNPMFLNRVADLYLVAGRGEEGQARFRTAVQAGHWIYGVGLARILFGSGVLEEAARAAGLVLDQDPLNEPAMAVLFRSLPADRRAAGVEERLDRALRINPRSVMFLNWKAILLEERGERDRAEALLLSALQAHPDHGGSVANLGAFYLRRKGPAKAAPLLQRAVSLEPGNLEARVNLGTALAMNGDLDGAIAAWEEAARRGVRTTDLYNALARAHHERGNDRAAVNWLRQSLDLDPTQDDIRQTLGQGPARPAPAQ